jgi:hypothetical protein
VGSCSRWEGDIGCGSDHGLRQLHLLPPPPRSCSTDSGRGKRKAPHRAGFQMASRQESPRIDAQGKLGCGSGRCSRWGSIGPTALLGNRARATLASCSENPPSTHAMLALQWGPSGASEGGGGGQGSPGIGLPSKGSSRCGRRPLLPSSSYNRHERDYTDLFFWRTKSPRNRTSQGASGSTPRDQSPREHLWFVLRLPHLPPGPTMAVRTPNRLVSLTMATPQSLGDRK